MDHTTLPESEEKPGSARGAVEQAALVIVWCKDEPWRIAETGPIPHGSVLNLGRGGAEADEPAKVLFGQQRPGQFVPSPALASRAISRRQLEVRGLEGGRLALKNQGRCALLHNRVETKEAECRPGDLIQIGKQLVLLCTTRPQRLPGQTPELLSFGFGEPDPHGIVGESPAIWALRHELAVAAARPGHVIITGPTGVGKELAAQAIHAFAHGRKPLVARNAATLPDALIDAELFGNVKNYPNPGMPDRPGLIGEADGSSLFLDEIGELPAACQAHLLRALDGGEYQRLGESKARRSNFRLLGATNRSVTSLKDDFAARFTFRLSVPDLNARLEDVPLLVRHILRKAAQNGDQPALRSFLGQSPTGQPSLPSELMIDLVTRSYTTHMRELQRLVLMAVSGSSPREQDAGDSQNPPAPSSPPGSESVLTPARIQHCLDENNGSIERTWRALGLANRFALHRLIKNHGLEIRRRAGESFRR